MLAPSEDVCRLTRGGEPTRAPLRGVFRRGSLRGVFLRGVSLRGAVRGVALRRVLTAAALAAALTACTSAATSPVTSTTGAATTGPVTDSATDSTSETPDESAPSETPDEGAPSGASEPASPTVQPVLPSPAEPGPSRTPPSVLTAPPAAGAVEIEAGAFTDRLEITDLALLADGPAVTGLVRNTVDISELIVLELRADFYDADGRYLGSGTATYADEEFTDTGATPIEHDAAGADGSFAIAVPSETPLTGAASAILTVPQLVNE